MRVTVVEQINEHEEQSRGDVAENPRYAEGVSLRKADVVFLILRIERQARLHTLYVKRVPELIRVPLTQVGVVPVCPYCETALSEEVYGSSHDVVVDCKECGGISYAQRHMDCKVSGEYAEVTFMVAPRQPSPIV